ncbi:conserved unknown protein [Ectocarpus siliculosus]|uniref:Phosphodiesterase n=1 Tax=Ectocarpus siliculosus TaxID=2880 RepID=D7G4U4_ECTSI|nr:conserved unknown protein [Ectocarpus siliculosus]|eukprot:CBJ27187.1 conserved unknown protein [Ectocarpus siliculosus]
MMVVVVERTPLHRTPCPPLPLLVLWLKESMEWILWEWRPTRLEQQGVVNTVTSDGGRRGAPSSGVSESDDGWSELGNTTGSENMLKFLETPFQKSVRLLNIACENVSDPIVRRVLKTVAQLLSDPDSLHKVKEGSIRRMTMDLGTRNYLENVLQTPVKSTSAEDNWKKLRTGMFVVRAMAREAAAAEDFLSAYETRQRAKSGESSVDNDNKKSELDDLLEDIENGVDTTTQDLVNTTIARKSSSAAAYAQDGESNRFSNFNRNLILGQQLVAKTLSRGDLRKDPDRLSVRAAVGVETEGGRRTRSALNKGCTCATIRRMNSHPQELRDLVSEHKTPDKIMELTTVEERAAHEVSEHKPPEKTLELTTPGERAAGAGQEDKEEHDVSPVQDDVCEMMLIPRLPILDESVVGNVASLLADGQFLKWEFNVFALEERSQGHSLWFAAMSAFSHYNLIGAFGLSVDRLSQLFLCVEATYCFSPEKPNSYHTHVHAADVTLTVSHFLSVDSIANTVRSTHGLALLMAAIMHDYRHPGVNNGYLVRDLDPLAVVYNDASVLENFHAAEGFKMVLDPTFDILKGWKPEDIQFFRHAFVKCILATDLALSLEYVSKFQSLTSTINVELGSGSGTAKPSGKPSGGENNSIQVQILVLQMVLKVADVAHPCKPWEVHHKWSELVTEEFFKQGDKEAARGLAVSPLCDRRDQNLPKSQCDFIDFIVRPCVTIFSMYCKVTTWNDQLDSNFRAWRALFEQQGGNARRPTSPADKRRSLR